MCCDVHFVLKVGHIAVESKRYFPTSSIYFQDEENGAVEILTGQEMFKQVLPTSQGDCMDLGVPAICSLFVMRALTEQLMSKSFGYLYVLACRITYSGRAL